MALKQQLDDDTPLGFIRGSVIQHQGNPRLIKIDYTARKIETRMAEIAARHGPVRHGPVRHGPVRHGPVRLLFSLRMPHAYAVEQDAHRTMLHARGVRHAGGEWYYADPAKARAIILKKARKVRRRARVRFSWPRGENIFVWHYVKGAMNKTAKVCVGSSQSRCRGELKEKHLKFSCRP